VVLGGDRIDLASSARYATRVNATTAGATALLANLAGRFEDDPTQLLEDVVSLAERGVEPLPQAAIKASIGRLAALEPSAILATLDAILVAPWCGIALRWLDALGALPVILPEVAALVGFHLGSPRPHKDLWDHTLRVLERVPSEPDLRWVALAHDIGKCATRAVLADGKLGFHRHEAVGARLFVGIGARLGMAPERAERIAFVIANHARTNQYEPAWSDRALRRLVRECGDRLPLMRAFSAADWTTKHRSKSGRILALQAELGERLARLEADGSRSLPAGTSEALMRAAGRGPGPWLAEARRELLARPELEAFGPEALAAAWLQGRNTD
jgi:poly(A) polymerase